MPRLLLCYLFNYYYTWLCSNTAVYATYCVVPENIHTPPPPSHGGHFWLRSPCHTPHPLEFPLLLNLVEYPLKNICVKNNVALYYYAKDNWLGYFLELHIFFYSLCKEMKQQMEEQTTVFVQITYKSQQQVPRHMSVFPKHMADICTSEYLAVIKFWLSARLKFIH